MENLELCGLQEDCPFRTQADGTKVLLSAEVVDEVSKRSPCFPPGW